MKLMTKKICAVILATLIAASSLFSLVSCNKNKKGDDASGEAPFIGENGNWWIGDTDTGVSAMGKDGRDGTNGKDGLNGLDGKNGTDGTDGINGADGVSPQIRINVTTKAWEISHDNGITWLNTGILAEGIDGKDGEDGEDGTNGEDGITPIIRINVNGRWEVSYDGGSGWSDLGVSAKGEKGEDGEDGISPLIKIENGNWHYSHDGGISWTDTGVKAAGVDGAPGKDGEDGADGKNGINGTDGKDGKDGVTPKLRINPETKMWEVSYNDGETWENLGAAVTGIDGATPKLRINSATNTWEVSYDEGESWESLGVAAKGENGEDGVSPIVKIDNGYWVVSYDNGSSWTNTNVKAEGTDGKDGIDGTNGKDGTTPKIRINPETNMWEVSYDNGSNWENLGAVNAGSSGSDGEDGRGIEKVEIIDGYLYVTYTDSQIPVNVGKVSADTTGGDAVAPSTQNYTDGLAFYPIQNEEGTDYTYGVAIGNAIYMRDIVIPNQYNGKDVTTILPGAFMPGENYELNLTSVTIPEGITKIGDEAFYNCYRISEIKLPSTIEEIGTDAFLGLGMLTESGYATIYINLTQAECEARGLALEDLGCVIVYAE